MGRTVTTISAPELGTSGTSYRSSGEHENALRELNVMRHKHSMSILALAALALTAACASEAPVHAESACAGQHRDEQERPHQAPCARADDEGGDSTAEYERFHEKRRHHRASGMPPASIDHVSPSRLPPLTAVLRQ